MTRTVAHAVEEAHRDGARLRCAWAEAGITLRTLQRWKSCEGLERGDRRPQAVSPVPAHALSEAEWEEILRIANEPRFTKLPPARIVLTATSLLSPDEEMRKQRQFKRL